MGKRIHQIQQTNQKRGKKGMSKKKPNCWINCWNEECIYIKPDGITFTCSLDAVFISSHGGCMSATITTKKEAEKE